MWGVRMWSVTAVRSCRLVLRTWRPDWLAGAEGRGEPAPVCRAPHCETRRGRRTRLVWTPLWRFTCATFLPAQKVCGSSSGATFLSRRVGRPSVAAIPARRHVHGGRGAPRIDRRVSYGAVFVEQMSKREQFDCGRVSLPPTFTGGGGRSKQGLIKMSR